MELCAEIITMVRRHLVAARDAVDGLISRLDGSGADLTRNDSAPPTAVEEAGAPSMLATAAAAVKASTVERKRRRQRQKQRQANGAAPVSDTVPALPSDAAPDSWPELRAVFLAEIERRSLSRDRVAAELHVSKGSISGWLSPQGGRPSDLNIARVRRWLAVEPPPLPPVPVTGEWAELCAWLKTAVAERGLSYAAVAGALGVEVTTIRTWLAGDHAQRPPGARLLIKLREWLSSGAVAPAAADGPAFHLTDPERDRLRGHLALEDARALRDRFGATQPLLEQAAMGAHLDPEIISKLRTTLANGADE